MDILKEILKEICEELNRVLVFDVEIVYACGEPYLCIFHDDFNENDFDTALVDIVRCSHMVKFYVNKVYSNKILLESRCVNSNGCDEVNCTFKVVKSKGR